MARGRETDTQKVAALIVKGNRGVFLRYKWPPLDRSVCSHQSYYSRLSPALSRDTQGLHVSRVKNSTGNGIVRVRCLVHVRRSLMRPSSPYFIFFHPSFVSGI